MLLFILPIVYFVISYGYLAFWHRKLFLWNTLIHENGRLTLSGSLFYYDHFIACLPMITLFALCTVAGFVLTGNLLPLIDISRVKLVTIILCLGSVLFLLFAFAASIYTVGWQRTSDYAFQLIERDGVMSKGGNWHQLQLSNIPIALGTIGISGTFIMLAEGHGFKANPSLTAGGIMCIGVATVLSAGISALNWCGLRPFLNPRWLAHSIREVATYPLTGIPVALASILLVEQYVSGAVTWTVEARPSSLMLIGISIMMVLGQLILLKNVNVLALSQKPSFAPKGLSVPYLLASHVFEHFLDFVFIGPLTGGVYALVRFLTL